MICPCGVCEKRFIGCHSDCDVYKAWKADYDALYGEARKSSEKMLNEFKFDVIQKQVRRRRRLKK